MAIEDSTQETWRPIVGYETCARGEQNGHATLTREMIVEGRALVAGGATQQAVADKLGVRQTTVSRFVNRTTWKHVE